MASVPFHYLDLRTFCYETEDEQRVRRALDTFLPPDPEIERDESSGHHGDRIVVISTRLELADEVRYVLDRITEATTFEEVLDRLAERVDEDCAFFVRFDKQRAYSGEIAFGRGIQLRGKVEAYPASRTGAIENLRGYFAADQ